MKRKKVDQLLMKIEKPESQTIIYLKLEIREDGIVEGFWSTKPIK